MRRAQPEAFHLPAPDGFRFCVAWQPPAGVVRRGAVVHVPAFAEEMNKSRRMVALQARAWAEQGWTVLVPDLRGCGDSAGDSGDASWDDWLEDVRRAFDWTRAQGNGPVWLWGLRHGALLATAAAMRFGLACGLYLWQPVANGKQHLQQFLRLQSMAHVVGKAKDERAPGPDQILQAGGLVEIAGYRLSPALAEGMRAATLTLPPTARSLCWLQLGPGDDAGPTPAAERLSRACEEAGRGFMFERIATPSFWQTQEIEVSEALTVAGCRLLAMESAEALCP
ncbi:hydrolase 2, exosortase A system-associated [Azoarcus indigens]|uniref:Exosortase A-associated hydrolase 2 n=1 Tax=Azoarcus indigens TaxID=29545 RepID=A0A4R6E798_9RHOO|nr:hydrolase 2, exosortase A system-associated [Azoarcus indigens]NMG63888.1 hydrolase 2, exosortase A system-associated [Azoarcus indigens]TDN53837.1 exosortase A-associated hydrolase 2 [Azoarcus indigens]